MILNDIGWHPVWKGLIRKANLFIILDNYFSLFVTGSQHPFSGFETRLPLQWNQGLTGASVGPFFSSCLSSNTLRAISLWKVYIILLSDCRFFPPHTASPCPLLSPPSLDFEYPLGSQMILLALFAALLYPVLARAACKKNLRVSGVGCQERKTKKLKPEHWNLKPQSLRPAEPCNADLALRTKFSMLNKSMSWTVITGGAPWPTKF
jgi:hypothetical protein